MYDRLTEFYFRHKVRYVEIVEFLGDHLLKGWVVAAIIVWWFSAAMVQKEVHWITKPAVAAAFLLAILWLLRRWVREDREEGWVP
jgi:hypothetical protein